MIGKKLGSYEIKKQIGRGGMGIVYEAFDHALRRNVAVKIIPGHLARHPDIISRFQKEARAAARLNHPGIVEIYGIGCEEGVHFFVMEYLGGESLEKILEKEKKLPCELSLRIIHQAASALHHAHRQGFIHRDIKPSNIVFNRETGMVKVTDFGIAKAMEGETQLTASDVRLGTPRYMSPEQVRGEELDPRSDIFSLGVVFFEMLTGKGPFGGDSFLVIMRKIIETEPEIPEECEAEIPPAVREMLRKSLAKDPDDRYQTAADLARAIERYQKGEGVPESAPGGKKLRSAVAAAAVFIILAGVGIFFLTRPEKNGRGAAGGTRPETKITELPQPPVSLPGGEILYKEAGQYRKNFPGNREGAIAAYRKVIAESPGSAWARRAEEEIQGLLKVKEGEESEAAGENAEKPDEDGGKARADELMLLGTKAMVEQNWQGAIIAFENAARAYRMTPEIREQLAEARLHRLRAQAEEAAAAGNREHAVTLYQQVLELDPANTEARREMTDLENSIRQNRQTDQDFKVSFDRGLALLDGGEPGKAVPELEKALSLKPQHQGAQELLKEARGRLNKAAKATILLNVTPREALIYLDDAFQGKAGDLSAIVTTPGSHVLKASCPDYQTHQGTVTLRGGETAPVSFSLQNKPRVRPVIVY